MAWQELDVHIPSISHHYTVWYDTVSGRVEDSLADVPDEAFDTPMERRRVVLEGDDTLPDWLHRHEQRQPV